MATEGKVRLNKRLKRYYIDITWNGKRENLYLYMGKMPCLNREAAEQFRFLINGEIQQGIFDPARHKRTRPLHLAEYGPKWLELKRPSISEATFHDYQNSLKNHILPILGDHFLPDITFDDLRGLQNGINRVPKGVKNVMDCLKAIFRDAKRSRHITDMPEFPAPPSIPTKDPEWMPQEDLHMILAHVPAGDRWIIRFMMLTACRPAEARALRKSDLKGDYIAIQGAFGRGEIYKEVKNKKAGAFPMIPAVRDLLNEMPKNLTPWVFINPRTGKPYDKNLPRIWSKACAKAGKRIKLYNAGRHSAAMHWLSQGLDIAIVSQLLRHSGIQITMDRYASYTTKMLGAALEGKTGNVSKMFP